MAATVLVIDDEPQIRDLLSSILEMEGYTVLVAADGRQGVELYRRQPADVVMTDMIMPEQEGIETIRELLRLNPEVKVVAMSGGGRLEPDTYLELAKRMGAAHTLTKPFSIQDVVETVKQLRGGAAP